MTNLQLNWTINHLVTKDDLLNLISKFKTLEPTYSGIDTETTGLHIILNKPFVVTFGWYNPTTKNAQAYSYDLTINQSLNNLFFKILYRCTGLTKKCIFWNAKFDMHMLHNINQPYPNKNITDSEIYVRLAHDAIPPSDGGITMNLKTYAFKYIDIDAKFYLNQIEKAKSDLLRQRNILIKQAGYTMQFLDEILNDKLKEFTDLPKDIQDIYNNTPNPENYINLPRDLLLKYACYDVIYTLEAHYQCLPIVIQREQMKVVEREEALIPVLWKMERCGFALNKTYAIKTKQILKDYILVQREHLKQLLQTDIKIGQHAKIKEQFKKLYNIELANSDSETMQTLSLNPNINVAETAKTISELRTLEKWYATYIIPWVQNIDKLDRIYTSINQCGAVSGRVTSDFQQFPNEPIVDRNNKELFNPRKLVKISEEKYNAIFYLDYSQIELRLQALYTIFVMGGDLNLCRAYMPFKCHNAKTNAPFNFNDPMDLCNYKQHKWILDENSSQEWHPIDMHTITTHTVFPEIDINSDEFKNHYRKLGKSTNFACNYGAMPATLQKQFGYSFDIAKKFYNSYISSFPGIKQYRNYIQDFLVLHPYVTNLFDRRYYGVNAHKGANYPIQGSGADLLKIKMIEIDKFLTTNKCQSRFQMNIHDEVSFELYDGENWIIPKIKEIMENLPGSPIPIIADVDITYTTWAEASKYEL